MNSVIIVLGGLGLFLYGMKIMSESLQLAAGEKMKNILWKATNNRVKGVFTGLFITSIIQSSSATTVMVISFVSAGIISLTQSIGLILGANIGTTITGWLVAILGFKVKITLLALPAIFLGFFIRFAKREKLTVWGEVLIGFGLLFLGLTFMSDAVKEFRGASVVLDFMSTYRADSYLSTLAVIGVGTVVTMFVQSSSATMAMTMTLAYNGLIDFSTACALVLGENIGTTITANLAAIGSSSAAKRAARAHFLFNIFGVIWVFLIFKQVFLPVVDSLVPGDVMGAVGDKSIIAEHLAAFHTLFNVTNTLIFLPLAPFLGKIASLMVKDRDTEGVPLHLHYISTSLVDTPAMNVNQARQGIQSMISLVITMYDSVIELIDKPGEKMKHLVKDILQKEDQIDMMERDLAQFLVQVSRANLSGEQSQDISRMLHMANDLERIGDHCESLVKLARRKYDGQVVFSANAAKQIDEISGFVRNALQHIYGNFNLSDAHKMLEIASSIENEIDRLKKKMKKEHINDLKKKNLDVQSGLIFIDMINHLERIGDLVFNVAESLSGRRVF
jgi:phosphate:Na+ symporter